MPDFSFERLILFIKIYDVDIFNAKLSRLPATQIPDCLCNAAGDKPSVRQANLVKSFEDLLEPPILPERDFEIVQRFLSLGRQFTSSSMELFPTVVSATSNNCNRGWGTLYTEPIGVLRTLRT